MRELLRYRIMAAICREKMASFPKDKQKWEIEALQWDNRALDWISFHFKQRNANRPVSSTASEITPNIDGSRWKTVAAA